MDRSLNYTDARRRDTRRYASWVNRDQAKKIRIQMDDKPFELAISRQHERKILFFVLPFRFPVFFV